jgi:uncharacterized protein YdhG (YjbR/CyaY superfamily)
MKSILAENVDQYIAGFAPDLSKRLQELRTTILKTAPQAEETIKYGIPTYVLHGNLVHFGGFKSHIALYPAPKKSIELQKSIAPYLSGQSTLKFPIDKPLPVSLIKKIVKYLVMQNTLKAQLKGKKSVRKSSAK